MLTVEIWAFLSGFSCPTPTLLLLAPILLGPGEATHSELLGMKPRTGLSIWNCLFVWCAFPGDHLSFVLLSGGTYLLLVLFEPPVFSTTVVSRFLTFGLFFFFVHHRSLWNCQLIANWQFYVGVQVAVSMQQATHIVPSLTVVVAYGNLPVLIILNWWNLVKLFHIRSG